MVQSSIRPTRFKALGYRQDAPDCWRIIDRSSTPGAAVGPQYASRGELLADLERFARQVGCAEAEPATPAALQPLHLPLCEPDAKCERCDAHRARARAYQRILILKAPDLKETLAALLAEIGEIEWDDSARCCIVIRKAEQLLDEIDAVLKR